MPREGDQSPLEWKKQTWCGPRNSLGGPCCEKAARKQSCWVMRLGHSPRPQLLLPGPSISANNSSGRNTCSPSSLGGLRHGSARRCLPKLWSHDAFFFLSLWNSSHGLNPFGGCPFPQTRAVDQECSLCLQP